MNGMRWLVGPLHRSKLTDQLRNGGYPLPSLIRTESASQCPFTSPARVSFPAPASRPVPASPKGGPAFLRSEAGPISPQTPSLVGNWHCPVRRLIGSYILD